MGGVHVLPEGVVDAVGAHLDHHEEVPQYKADTDPNTAGNQPGKWAERVLTANNASVVLPPATVPWPTRAR